MWSPIFIQIIIINLPFLYSLESSFLKTFSNQWHSPANATRTPPVVLDVRISFRVQCMTPLRPFRQVSGIAQSSTKPPHCFSIILISEPCQFGRSTAVHSHTHPYTLNRLLADKACPSRVNSVITRFAYDTSQFPKHEHEAGKLRRRQWRLR